MKTSFLTRANCFPSIGYIKKYRTITPSKYIISRQLTNLVTIEHITPHNISKTHRSPERYRSEPRPIEDARRLLQLQRGLATFALDDTRALVVLVFVVLVLLVLLEAAVAKQVGRAARLVQRAPHVRDLAASHYHRRRRLLLLLEARLDRADHRVTVVRADVHHLRVPAQTRQAAHRLFAVHFDLED